MADQTLSMNLSMKQGRTESAGVVFDRSDANSASSAYSGGVNSPPHNPSGRGFEPHPPHQGCDLRLYVSVCVIMRTACFERRISYAMRTYCRFVRWLQLIFGEVDDDQGKLS